jgi:hypothetical protein
MTRLTVKTLGKTKGHIENVATAAISYILTNKNVCHFYEFDLESYKAVGAHKFCPYFIILPELQMQI